MKQTAIILSLLTLCSSFVYARDTVGEIYDAIQHEDVEMVKTALAADTNAVNYVGEKKYTLLHFAAEHSSSNGTKILKLLLASGAKVEAKNHIGQTPLFGAVIYNNPEGTKILIEHGAKVNARQDDGRTPLHCAALNGYCDVARVLIASDAAISAKSSDGKTPLALALEEQEQSRKGGDTVLVKRYQDVITLLRESEKKKK
jgi:ankyrin repeat protein